MSGYEQRLAADKRQIRARVVAVGYVVEAAVTAAVEALLSGDRQRSYETILGDLPINREIRAIDNLCHAFIARHLPSAGHLRFVSSVLHMNVALERTGDYAVTISREAVQLSTPPTEVIAKDVRALCRQSCEVLKDALLAFAERDAALARQTRPRAKFVERTYSQLYRDLTTEGAELPISDAFALLAIYQRLERVNDQAKNISEETLFELTGETKAPKHYKLLFVDDDSATLAPLAEALARKAFPNSGSYQSAGLCPSPRLSAELERIARELPIDLGELLPRPVPARQEELEQYDVIVALTPGARSQLVLVPYGTVLLYWDVVDKDAASSPDALLDVSHALAARISDLMVLMRGDDAT